MLNFMLSEFLGETPICVRETYTCQALNVQVSNIVDTTEVPLIIQENRIKNEKDPGKRQALQKQYEDLKSVSKAFVLHWVV